MTTMLVLLLGITVLSFVPLAGTQGGWAHFQQSNINTDIMQQLGLAPWNHFIDVGYIKVCMPPSSLAASWRTIHPPRCMQSQRLDPLGHCDYNEAPMGVLPVQHAYLALV